MKIVVRSYKRSDTILQKTLRVLRAQKDLDLEDCLYVVVHQDERSAYEAVLKNFPHAGLILKSQRGCHNSVKAAVEHFPDGEKIIFLDDDIDKIMHMDRPLGTYVPLDCLGRYASDAFSTASKVGCSLWSVSQIQNSLWVSQKPWKEFRPCPIAGGLWGAYNSPHLVTEFAHEEDTVRACRLFAKEGGGIIYNWIYFKSKAQNPGGMQTSGDRGAKDEVKAFVEHLFQTEPEYRMFRKGPVWLKSFDNWSSRLKSVNTIQKLRPFSYRSWSSFFQQDEDAT